MTGLLPINSTLLERALDAATADLTPIPLREIYDPLTCPVQILPFLAWECSVDRWDEAWPVNVKRAAISASYYIHKHKGTIGAIRRVVEPLGYLVQVREWWQSQPEGIPGTFALEVGVLETGITEATYEELVWLIDDAKPLTRHLTGLAISLETTGTFCLMACLCDGDEIDVYPPEPRDIEVTGHLGLSGRETSIDTLDVFHD
jgi:phage tail P2-like protein